MNLTRTLPGGFDRIAKRAEVIFNWPCTVICLGPTVLGHSLFASSTSVRTAYDTCTLAVASSSLSLICKRPHNGALFEPAYSSITMSPIPGLVPPSSASLPAGKVRVLNYEVGVAIALASSTTLK